MNGTLAENLAIASATLDVAAGQQVYYLQAGSSGIWRARPLSPEWEAVPTHGILRTFIKLDFVGLASTFPFDAPELGDILTWADGTTWQVLSEDNRRVFELSEYGETMRIHTKQVKAAEV